MNLFSKIGSLFKEKPSDSIMDDNVAIAAEDNNPYVSAAVLGARNAYDTLHMLMGPLIKGKKSSLKQIDKWLNDWLDRLKQIEEMYAELLGKINDLGADFTGTFTLDFAKEAWEIVQDTPILRRYMGEANYWALYDAMGDGCHFPEQGSQPGLSMPVSLGSPCTDQVCVCVCVCVCR